MVLFKVIHFNVSNTLIETSMFCVRLILHAVNVQNNQAEKASTMKKLTEIYSDMIKK
jgi:hypothetical protein